MNNRKAWWLGFFIIVTFVFVSELTVVFREYVYVRIGLSRNVLLFLLWFLPIVAAFLVVYLSRERGLPTGLSLIPVLTILGPSVHFFIGELGGDVDFAGLLGLKVNFQIYFLLSGLTICFGAAMGLLFKKKKQAE